MHVFPKCVLARFYLPFCADLNFKITKINFMKTTKFVLFAALGVAAVLLLTSDSAKELREELEENAMKNAKKWKKKLGQMGSDATDKLADLKSMVSSEIEGLSDDARERIETILNDTTKAAGKVKAAASKQLS